MSDASTFARPDETTDSEEEWSSAQQLAVTIVEVLAVDDSEEKRLATSDPSGLEDNEDQLASPPCQLILSNDQVVYRPCCNLICFALLSFAILHLYVIVFTKGSFQSLNMDAVRHDRH